MDQPGHRRRHTRAPTSGSRAQRGGGPGGKPAHGQPPAGRRGTGPGDLPDRPRPAGPPLRGKLRPLDPGASRGRGAAPGSRMKSTTADRRPTPVEEDGEGLGRKDDPGDGRHRTTARRTSLSAPHPLYPALCVLAVVRREASRLGGRALDWDHRHPSFHAALSFERSGPTEAGGMLPAPKRSVLRDPSTVSCPVLAPSPGASPKSQTRTQSATTAPATRTSR